MNFLSLRGLVAAGLLAGPSLARECGETLTRDCIDDKRYFEGGHNLIGQSSIWGRSGFYRVDVFDYDGNYNPASQDETRDVKFPLLGFVNITVAETRYYSHGYYILPSTIPSIPSEAYYRELYGHSNFEKDGIAHMMEERIQDHEAPFGEKLPFTTSVIVPVGQGKSVRRTKLAVPRNNSQELTWEVLTCQEGTNCRTMSFTEEHFGGGKRVAFQSGTYTQMNETDWIAAIIKAYEDNNVDPSFQKPVPMSGCLVNRLCVTEDDWCDHDDPSCNESPYQQEDGRLRKGVIASLVIFLTIFLVGGLYILWLWYSATQEKRYRTAWVSRFVEDLSLQKAMKNITPENMSREFTFIDRDNKGYFTKGELIDFMLTTTGAPIKDGDFSKLWGTMDLNKNGTIDFVEFCAFTADCYQEHSMLRFEDAKKQAAEHSPPPS